MTVNSPQNKLDKALTETMQRYQRLRFLRQGVAEAISNALPDAKVDILTWHKAHLASLLTELVGEDEDILVDNRNGEAAYNQAIGMGLGRNDLRAELREKINKL